MQITIKEIQNQWGIARATIYKHIKSGKLSRLDNGLIDVSEVIRVYGEPSKNTQVDIKETRIDDQEKQILLQKIAFLESSKNLVCIRHRFPIGKESFDSGIG